MQNLQQRKRRELSQADRLETFFNLESLDPFQALNHKEADNLPT